MLVSIHIPKTAGTSFGTLLQQSLGERLMMDYGDWVGWETPESLERRAERVVNMRSRREELLLKYHAIHGHFIADKYMNLFPDVDFITFVRDPYQQAISNYEFIIRNPQIDHPAVHFVHQEKLTLIDFIRWDMRRNVQSLFIGNLPLKDLAMIGITEQFTRSLALFNKMFGLELTDTVLANTNPIRRSEMYEISQDVRDAVNEYCDHDLELYRIAQERYSSLLIKWNV